MIRVTPTGEPGYFDARVRTRRNSFLATVPAGQNVDYSGHAYWTDCKGDLRKAFNEICAYTALYVEEVTGAESVEHFVPKQERRDLAYEWGNYRFVCSRMNSRKGVNKRVIDPFAVPPSLFQIDFPSMLTIFDANAAAHWKVSAQETIDALNLNDERCVRARLRYATNFARGDISPKFLAENAPLIASELARLGISRADLLNMFSAQV